MLSLRHQSSSNKASIQPERDISSGNAIGIAGHGADAGAGGGGGDMSIGLGNPSADAEGVLVLQEEEKAASCEEHRPVAQAELFGGCSCPAWIWP